MSNFLGDINLDELVESIYRRDPKATLWDVVVAVLAEKGNIEPYVIWILSDLPVLEMTAKGHTIDYIAEFLELHRKEVLTTCATWGIIPNTETLDFDPTQVYRSGMTVQELEAKVKPVLASALSQETLENVILNMEKYLRVVELLDEERNNEKASE
jgi:hypothetical protein